MINEKLDFFLSEKEKTHVFLIKDNPLVIIINTHELSRYSARMLINKVIAMSDNEFWIIVNHGYNNGTKIMRMISEKDFNYRIKEYVRTNQNKGVTYLKIKHR